MKAKQPAAGFTSPRSFGQLPQVLAVFMWFLTGLVFKYMSLGCKSGLNPGLCSALCGRVYWAQCKIELHQLINNSNSQPLGTGVIDCREHKIGTRRPDEILPEIKAGRNWP